jgi:hypothetical protein
VSGVKAGSTIHKNRRGGREQGFVAGAILSAARSHKMARS